MPVHNSEIAAKLREMADLLEISQANRFRIRAYRNAALRVETLADNIRDLVKADADLTEIQDIGPDIAAKLKQLVETGEMVQLKELKQQLPAGLIELLHIEGLGPKRVQQLYKELGVESTQDLFESASANEIQKLAGFGPKLEAKLLKKLVNKSGQEARTLRPEAEEVINPLVEYLSNLPGVKRVAAAGSLRRKKETVGDVDILAASSQGEQITQAFIDYEDVARVISQGETRSSVVLRTGLQVDLRVVEDDSFGSALQYFTGSKAHNISLRQLAISQDCKLNEYGLFRGEAKLAGKDEKEIYQQLGLDYIVPELRENRGEIEAAKSHHLPDLITLSQIKGDLQLHTNASDGAVSLAKMAEAARGFGYEYIAVTDHSQNLNVAGGLSAKDYREQFKLIDELNARWDDFVILKSAEVDILKDGSLDLDETILAEFDIVLCSIHSHFNLSSALQTKRLLKALRNPFCDILAHPTGRLINSRVGYEFDLVKVIETAAKTGTILEINAHPNRLDLDDLAAKMAKDAGVKLSLGTDAHSPDGFGYMRLGVDQARRGWLEAENVVNTWELESLREWVKDGK